MMDRRLKERLVGATILVALIVIIVPELLSGPKHPALPPLAAGLPTSPTRSVSVDLATNRATAEPEAGAASQAAPGETQKPPNPASSTPATSGANNTAGTAPPADTGEPAAASAPSVATLKAQNTAQAPLETAASSPKSPTATSHAAAATETSAASHHAWAVQLGSFASKENAERLMHRLQASGGSFYVAPGGSGSALRYRVRMGPLADRGSAERALAKLKAQGHAGTIVAPTS